MDISVKKGVGAIARGKGKGNRAELVAMEFVKR